MRGVWDELRLVLLAGCLLCASVGPGLLLVRRARLAPPERLVVAVGLSQVLLYLVCFLFYLTPLSTKWHVVIALAYAAATLASLPQLFTLFHNRRIRIILAAYGGFLLWALLLVSFIRHYGGGTWSGDWLEHFERSLFFLERHPPTRTFLELYPLSARPPMMNTLAAHFMALAGPRYEVYQLTFLFLNSLVFLPCCLLAPNLVPPKGFRRLGRWTPTLLILLLAASPMVAQNATYAWTKLYTAFYVLLALHLYLRGWRKSPGGAPQSLGLAFAFLAAGCVVHYSAGPYALFVGLHYLFAVLPRRPASLRWRECAQTAIGTVAVLGPWFLWSVLTFGPETTFGATSTVADSARMTPAENVRNVARNLSNTIVPTVVRNPSILGHDDLRQPNPDGRRRDFYFLIYQVSLPGALGSGGFIVLLCLLWRFFNTPGGARDPTQRTPDGRPSERRFWLFFVPFVFIVGVAVYGGVDRFGVAHITLQPLALVGLCFVAAGLGSAPLALRWLLAAGLLFDFAMGIQNHFMLQHHLFELIDDGAGGSAILWTPDVLSRGAQYNFLLKQRDKLVFWGDRFSGYVFPLQVLLLFGIGALLAIGLRPYVGKRRMKPEG